MKYIVYIMLIILSCFSAKAQVPTGVPTQKINGWIENWYTVPDSGSVITKRDTNFIPRFVGTTITWQRIGVDTIQWFWNGLNWRRTTQLDTIPLHNQILLKLNISDTASMLLPYLRKADTTNKWVNNIRRRSGTDTVELFKNGSWQFAYKDSVGVGASGLTSVGLSMPSAFTVTNSPLTSNGTISVSAAGTTLQYIRANGTVATTDTGMIPNFTSKVRGLFSSTSPISYNSSNGTFSLNDVGLAGACTNCSLTIDVKGRVTLYANGTSAITSLSAIGSSPNANGATITGTALNLEPASAAFGGVITTGTQTLAGAKTFSSAPTFSTITPGSVLFGGTGGLVSQNNSNLFWDNSNIGLGIGTTTIASGNRLQINGNAGFSNVRLGLLTTFTDAAISAGMVASTVPFISFYNALGATDAKIWDFQVNGNDFVFNIWNDAITNGIEIMKVRRSGNNVTSTYFTNGNWAFGSITTPTSFTIGTNDAIRIPSGNTGFRPTGAYGEIRVNTDSTYSPEYYDSTAWRVLASRKWVRDNFTQNTLYTGDGTLAGNRTVTGSSNNLTFNGIFNYRINANGFILDKTTATAPYTQAVIGTPNQLWIAYTPTVTVYSKGAAIIIDTNNNVSLGSGVMPTTAPLYTAGSAYIQGLQSSSGNFYRVMDIAANQTLNLTHYWVNADATGGNITITLPAASTAFGSSMGILYVIRRVDASANTITITRAGTDTINGATTTTLTTQYQVKEIQCVSASTWAIK